MMCFEAIEPLEPRRLLSAVRLAVIGDFSSDEQVAPTRDVASLVKSWGASDVITVGDNNYPDGAASTIDSNVGQWYHPFLSPYTGSYGAGSSDGANHFWPALGNHDWNTGTVKPFTDYFNLPNNERYYARQIGNVAVFVVDSDPHEPDGTSAASTQANAIRSAMLNSNAQWKLVFFHQPAYSSGGMGNNAYMQWPFASWGATAVFAGHDHDYERLSENGIPYFVDGLGGESIVGFGKTIAGSQVRYAGDYGAMKVDASDTSITFQFITRGGSLIDSYTIGAVTAPAAPSNLAASAASASIKLTWQDNSSNESGFEIDRSIDAVSFTTVATVASGSTSYTDASVIQGKTYYYRVRATNSGGDSSNSSVASATVPGSTNVNLIPPGDSWKFLDNGSNPGTAWRAISFDDSAWKSGRAEFGYGDGDEATVVGYGSNASNKYVTTFFRHRFNVDDPSSVSALNMQIVQDDGAVVYLNGTEVYRWDMPAGTIGYTTLATDALGGSDESVWRGATIDPALLVAGTNVIAVEIHQSDLDSSDISFNYELAGAMSQISSTPATPSNLVATPLSATQIMLTWHDNATNEDGFSIERSIDGVSFSPLATVGPNIASYADGSLSAKTYYYRVQATDSAGKSGYSNIASCMPYTIPAAPTNLAASAGVSSINLSWSDNSTNESGFKIERSTDNVNFALVYSADEDVASYSDVNVSVGTSYSYRVRATNPAGDSAYTNTTSATITAAAQTVFLSDIPWVSATNGYGPVELDESNGSSGAGDGSQIMLNGVSYAKGLGVHADSQIVYNLAGKYSLFNSDVGIDDEVSDTGTVIFQVLVDGMKVFDSGIMRATAVTQSINLDVTDAQQLTLLCIDDGDGYVNDHADWAGARLTSAGTVNNPPPPNVPNAPSNLAATVVGNAINLSWNDNSNDETGFKVERSTDGVTFAPLVTVGSNMTGFTDSGLAFGVRYFYRVRAAGGSADSAASNIVTATTPLPSPWTQGEIGSVKTGSAAFNNYTWTISGAGADISGKNDSFHFVYQRLSGDGTILARVANVQNTSSSAKAGVMIRESLATNSKQALVDVRPSGSVDFIRRTSTNGNTSSTSSSGSSGPMWVKLVRSGNTFTAYKSTNGTSWSKIGSTSITMASSVYIGLVVCSRSTSSLNTSSFDNVQLSGGVAAQATATPNLFNSANVSSNLSSVLA